MVHLANHHLAWSPGDLGMASQTEIGISLHQQLVIHRTMGPVAGSTAFPHGFMLEHKIPGLFMMALGT